MKQSILVSSILILFCIQSFQSMAQQQIKQYDKQYLQDRPSKLPTLRSAFIENESVGDWDLTYNRLDLTVDPAIDFINGKVLFEFTSLVDNLLSITINLNDSLKVTSVASGNKPLTFSHENGFVRINLVSTLKKADRDSFTISYEGIPTKTGLSSFLQETHKNIPVIYTLSEPYGANEWWPCKESLSDKIDSIDILVETPSLYRSASNGILYSDLVIGSKRICHWKHRHPISTYLVFFSTTQYEVYSDWATLEDGTKVEILNYIYPETLEKAKLNTPLVAQYLEYFSRKFIDYPFKNEKYGHAEFGWNGGMENQTMSSIGVFVPEILAHEAAHQWFGDYITCANWNEIWLNEGFATYLAELVNEEFIPINWAWWKSIMLTYITALPDGSVYVKDISDVNRIFDSRLSYEKGAYVLHMLRGQIGDNAFFKGMKNYLNDSRAINGFATTAIYRENMEQAADTSLTEFFQDWIWGEGHPIYDIEWKYSDKQISIDVYQKPSALNGPFFEMKLPITVAVNGIETIYWLANTQQSQRFSIPSPTLPDSVMFNKDYWILGEVKDFHTSIAKTQQIGMNISYNASDKFLKAYIPETNEAPYTIYDMQGRLVKSGIWKKSKPLIELDKFNPGVYLLYLSTPQKTYHSRFICN